MMLSTDQPRITSNARFLAWLATPTLSEVDVSCLQSGDVHGAINAVDSQQYEGFRLRVGDGQQLVDLLCRNFLRWLPRFVLAND